MGLALRSDAVELARAFRLDTRVANLVEISEGRINHAGTGAVEATGALLDGFDQFIAVSGALGQQGEDQKLEILRAELTPHRKVTATSAAHKTRPSMTEAVSAMVATHGEDPVCG